MAEVTLGQFEMENNRLPAVCVCCGAPATSLAEQKFKCQPADALVHLSITEQRRTAWLPVCDRHQRHWSNRRVVFAFILAFTLGLPVLGIGINLAGLFSPVIRERVLGLTCLGFFAGLLLWLAVAFCFEFIIIKATAISERSLTLKNVSPEFESALIQMRGTPPPG